VVAETKLLDRQMQVLGIHMSETLDRRPLAGTARPGRRAPAREIPSAYPEYATRLCESWPPA